MEVETVPTPSESSSVDEEPANLSTLGCMGEGTGMPLASSRGDGKGDFFEEVAELAKSLETLMVGSNQDKETNFTWEHFFVTHCGILAEDALEYESHLIAHRLSPEDTLLESLSLLVELGRIPIGDKLNIVKALKRQEASIKATQDQAEQATKILGLEKYNEFEAGQIIRLGGGTSEDHIDWGIEQFEDNKIMLEKLVAEAMLKDHKARDFYLAGAAHGMKEREPAMKLLRSLGYMTFDYTKGKSVESPIPQRGAASNNPVLNDILLGNLEQVSDDRSAARLDMYS
jgi:hypothetical protein